MGKRSVDWGAFVLRVVLGIIFYVHGMAKVTGGMEHVTAAFASIGLSAPVAYGVTFLELAGGLLLIFGVATRLLAGLFVLLMAGAIAKVKAAVGFMSSGGETGYEFNLILMAAAFYLFLNGSKWLAIDESWSIRKRRG